MEEWVPLFEIFLKRPAPETEASRWLEQVCKSASSTSSLAPTAAPINWSSFVSLLEKPCDVIDQSSSPATKKVLFIQTLPSMVRSRILSFLLVERRRFCPRDLSRLAQQMLSGGEELDFWVQRAAHNLLDEMPKTNYESISHLNLDSVGGRTCEEFESIPDWLKEKAGGATGTVFPWLPVSHDDIDSKMLIGDFENEKDSMSHIGENMEEDSGEVVERIEANNFSIDLALQPEVHEKAANLRAQIISFESTSKAITLCDEIRKFCLEKGRDSLGILGLIEPWNVDDETASIFLSNLPTGSEEEELGWPSQVLCSVVLPKFLVLEKSASRVLMSATIEFCKVHQRAAEYALIFPLIFRREGINNSICEVISRVLKECWHLGHISAFCQKLLCGGAEERRSLSLPCHRNRICDELTWNEALFILFQNILNHDVPLTQESVDRLVFRVREVAERFSKSLKFGNFLLHFVAKCVPLLRAHKHLLIETAECTNNLVTKSVLSKLGAL